MTKEERLRRKKLKNNYKKNVQEEYDNQTVYERDRANLSKYYDYDEEEYKEDEMNLLSCYNPYDDGDNIKQFTEGKNLINEINELVLGNIIHPLPDSLSKEISVIKNMCDNISTDASTNSRNYFKFNDYEYSYCMAFREIKEEIKKRLKVCKWNFKQFESKRK